MFSCEYCESFKNSYFHRKPPVASFDNKGLTGQNFVVAIALEAQLKMLKDIFAFVFHTWVYSM